MSEPADWFVAHPRLGAGLWFASCLVLSSLVFLFLVGLIGFTFFHATQIVRPVSVRALVACFLSAMGMGSVFGARLIRPDAAPAASDGYRVGAFVGLCSGVLSNVMGMGPGLWRFWRSAGPEGAFSGIVMMIGFAFLTSITYLPFGVLAGWSLVRVGSFRRRRPMKGVPR